MQSQSQNNGSTSREAKAWTNHEHTAQPVERDSGRSVQDVGSPELAKHVAETSREQSREVSPDAASDRPTQDTQQDNDSEESVPMSEQSRSADEKTFAEQCGFGTFDELIAASQAATAENNVMWYRTPLAQDRWMIWRLDTLGRSRSEFDTEDAALQALKNRGQRGFGESDQASSSRNF